MNSSISVHDRRSVTLTGVKSVESITDTRVSVYTQDGDLIIKGEGLEADEFDPANGVLRLRGRADSLCYTTEKRHLPDNIITKLFR